MKQLSLFAATAALSLGGIAFAHAEEDMHPAVVARHAHMQLLAHNIGVLGGMAQGKMDYDAEQAQAAANSLAAVAGLSQQGYWPEGTAEGTRALPAIWDNMDDYMSKNDDLAMAAAAMADVAGTDLASLQGAMGNLGGTCSACHREYRQRDN